jgi:L-rhamnonate dehydratase
MANLIRWIVRFMAAKKLNKFLIKDIRAYAIQAADTGGDYHRRAEGHWITDTLISNPMSHWAKYREKRTSWGIGSLGSVVVEIEAADGTVGTATGMGGVPCCYIIEKHFRRFLVDADARDTQSIWDQMYRASLFYGRKGLTVTAISVVDLALWDLLGQLRQEPVWAMIGGRTRDSIPLYCTGPDAGSTKNMGFWGAKVPLREGPADGPSGLRRNVEHLAECRAAVGPDYPLMVDCYMSLDVPYAIDLAHSLRPLGIYWIEEPLNPDDIEGHRRLKQACPEMRWTTGEHEYTRYGFRPLIESRCVDILQPDVMWVGGLTELMRIGAMAAAYDIPVVPHGSGAYSYHYVITQAHTPFCEYVNMSQNGDKLVPLFGTMFSGDPLPENGAVKLGDEPGFGLTLNRSELKLERPFN